MRSIKIHDDTDAMLTALRGRIGSTKDEVIQELVRRHTEAVSGAVTAGDRLRRIEELLTRLTLEKQDEEAAPPTFQVK